MPGAAELRRALGRLGEGRAGALGDFTPTGRLVPMSLAAVGIGVLAAYVALALLRLIGLFTNLFFFQRWDFALVSPAGHQLGVLAVLVPVLGALVVGLMARYGSERIRGHGIPEAIESILIRGSRVEPRVAVLKPLSAAISSRRPSCRARAPASGRSSAWAPSWAGPCGPRSPASCSRSS